MSACGICNHENVEELERLGALALKEDLSWREAARQGGLSYHQSLKNHMERHWVSPVDEALEGQDQLDADIIGELQLTQRQLLHQMRLAPVEVKPLYLSAIQNLRGLLKTKPSQQHLIAALKTIHEVTGMRMEQQMLLAFAREAFGAAPETLPESPTVPALPVPAEVQT